MTTGARCEHCDEYQKQGHNYCRMCGFHVTKGYVQKIRLATAYSPNERFCGYCGGEKFACSCYSPEEPQ